MAANQTTAVIKTAHDVSALTERLLRTVDQLLPVRELIQNGQLDLNQVDLSRYPQLAGLGDWTTLTKWLDFLYDVRQNTNYQFGQQVATLIVED